MKYYKQNLAEGLLLGYTTEEIPDNATEITEAAYNRQIEEQRIATEKAQQERFEQAQAEVEQRKNKIAELVAKMTAGEPLMEDEVELLIERLA